jgi:hypothetical protein
MRILRRACTADGTCLCRQRGRSRSDASRVEIVREVSSICTYSMCCSGAVYIPPSSTLPPSSLMRPLRPVHAARKLSSATPDICAFVFPACSRSWEPPTLALALRPTVRLRGSGAANPMLLLQGVREALPVPVRVSQVFRAGLCAVKTPLWPACGE